MTIEADLAAARDMLSADAALMRSIVRGPASGPGSLITIPSTGQQVKSLSRVAYEGATGTALNTINLAPSAFDNRSLAVAIQTQQYASGTTAGPTPLNHLKIWADDVAAANAGGTDYFVEGFTHEHYFGGSNARGGRQGLTSYLYLTAATNAANDNGNYVALVGVGTAQASDGGSAAAYVGGRGAIFGLGAVGQLSAGATNFINVTAAEFNVAVHTGASVAQKTLIQLSARADDRVKGAAADAMILASNQDALNPKWDYGILFNYRDDPNVFPFNASSTVMKTGPGTIGWGIDFSASTVATAAFKSPGFQVLGDGSVNALNIGAVGSIAAGASAPIYFTGRSQIVSSADGYITLRNDAATAFTMVQFGGGTSSFPALKRNGALLEFRLADDSGFASLSAENIGATGSIAAGASAPIYFATRSQIVSTADGYVTLRNAAATGFTMLQLGGSTSSFPALKRSSADLHVRLADDSGYAALNSGQIIAAGLVYSDPASGDARIGGEAASGTDRVRFEAVIPGSGTWYWGADGSNSSKFKLDWDSASFATPNIDIDPTSHVITLSTYGTSGSRQVLVLNGVNSSPAANDIIYSSAYLTNTSAAQVEIGRITYRAATVTAGAETSHIRFSVRTSGSFSERLVLTGTLLAPAINDGVALGDVTLGYSDLHLATGGEINWANGNFRLIHSSGLLTVGDGSNLAFGTTTGTKIGTSTTQKIGFFNATPVVRQAAPTDTASIIALLQTYGLCA